MANTSAVYARTELQKGIDSLKLGKAHTLDEVDAELDQEFGI